MPDVSRRKLFAGLVTLPVLGSLSAFADKTAPAPAHKFTPRISGREMLRKRYFPNFELITQDGKKMKFYDDMLKDKIVVLNMMYADCEGVCPLITMNLKRVQKILNEQIKHEIFFYSMTVKPEQDSPEKLREYVKMHRIDTRYWQFLTGKPEEMDIIRHLTGFADPDPEIDKDKARHSGMIRYGNEPMALWGTCQGSGKPEWMATEIGFSIPREFKRHPAVNE
jgi:protein SCO1/2